jgi:hypothetical protein
VLNKIFSPFLLIFSVIMFGYIFFQSEIILNSEKRNYYLLYYIISITLIIISIISFFLDKKIRTYLIIILISIFSTLYIFEIILSYDNYFFNKEIKLKEKIYNQKTEKLYDKRSKFKIYKDLKKNNKNITLAVPPFSYLFEGNLNKIKKDIFPLSGISNSKTIHCNESGFYSIYQSDRYGFNNPDKEWDNEEVEILLIGDSFAHGACVNRPNDIGSVLRNLTDSPIINLGYSSSGPLIEYASLREYAPKKTNHIVWIYFEGNDLDDLQIELQSKLLNKYITNLNYSQKLKNNQMLIDLVSNQLLVNEKKYYIKNFIKLGNFVNFIKQHILSNNNKIYQKIDEKKNINDFIDIIKLANKFAKNNNSKFYFVYLPDTRRLIQKYSNKNYDSIKYEINRLGIPFLDINKEVVEKEKNPLILFPFEIINHYNSYGYNKVANSIYKMIYK